jgi:RNA polymerase sigma-70 factor (ECF subfamily)
MTIQDPLDFDTDDCARQREPAGLVAAMARGDAAALSELFDRFSDRVYAVAWRLLRLATDAEEVVLDVFHQAWCDAAQYDAGRSSVESWLACIAYSRSIDLLRRRRARPDLQSARAVEELGFDAIAIEDAGLALVEFGRQTQALRSALVALTETQRSLIGLAFLEGMSHQEIAARTGMPLGTVKSHVRRGLLELRKALLRE